MSLRSLAARQRRAAVALGIVALALFALGGVLLRDSPPAAANPIGDVAAIDAGDFHTCLVTSAGGAKCWGSSRYGEVGAPAPDTCSGLPCALVPQGVSGLASGVSAVSAGSKHTCALTTAGGVKCWGRNFEGQLGDGMACGSICTAPVNVAGLVSSVTQIAAGTYRSCAVATGGEVVCWGSGFGSTPAGVPGLAGGGADVAVGNAHNCALTTAGGVKCWGLNPDGQLGDGTTTDSSIAVDVVGLASGAVDVSAGFDHTCAITSAGGVKCWGANHQGQLGDGAACGEACSTPVDVVGLGSGVVALSLAAVQSCALTGSGAVKCWGDNNTTPQEMAGLDGGIAAIAIGGDHGCALTEGGSVKCWGNNGYGQLGDGTTYPHQEPVNVVELLAKPTPTPTPCDPVGCPPTPTPAPCPAEVCMPLVVEDDSGSPLCRSDPNTKCSIPTNGGFRLLVEASKVPAQGYVVMQTFLDYGLYDPSADEDFGGPGSCGDGFDNGDGLADRRDEDCVEVHLVYKPASPIQEIVWPDLANALAIRGQLGPGLVHHGGVTGIAAPAASHYVGTVVELEFNCSAEPSQTDVALLPDGHPFAFTSGALYSYLGANLHQVFAIPPATSLTINCVTPVGGVSLSDGELGGLQAASGGSAGVVLGVVSAMAALAALGGVAWYVRRRTITR